MEQPLMRGLRVRPKSVFETELSTTTNSENLSNEDRKIEDALNQSMKNHKWVLDAEISDNEKEHFEYEKLPTEEDLQLIQILEKANTYLHNAWNNLETDQEEAFEKSNYVCVIKDPCPLEALNTIFTLPKFDIFAPKKQFRIMLKKALSMNQVGLGEDNLVLVDVPQITAESKEENFSVMLANTKVKHEENEFITFCTCKMCLTYREILFHLMVEQFQGANMVVLLLDVLVKCYGPLLKNPTAYNNFEKYMDGNRQVYWLASGYTYNKKIEHMDFIFDRTLTDNMIFVIFSSVLLVHNPMLLLEILSYHIECIFKAYAEGAIEIVESDDFDTQKSAENFLNYVLDGYDHMLSITDYVASYFYALEKVFLSQFKLSWRTLCERLYYQHVFANLSFSTLACIITLRTDDFTKYSELFRRYRQVDDKMTKISKQWPEVWKEIQKFNLSPNERKRRARLMDVYNIFDTVVCDSITMELPENDDENDFYDFPTHPDRRKAWQNVMSYTRMKWPEGFFKPPNVLICENKCTLCDAMLDYHLDNCKCVTCSIAGGPTPPEKHEDKLCMKCRKVPDELLENADEMNSELNDKFSNTCENDMEPLYKLKDKLVDLSKEIPVILDDPNSIKKDDTYHIAWAIFKHFPNRIPFKKSVIKRQYFCRNCPEVSCKLAQKILNNELAKDLMMHLIERYQPISMSRDDLRALLPNIMFYNYKMITNKESTELSLVVSNYWTFIISVFATYFIEYTEDTPINLTLLRINNNDIEIDTESLTGNKNDHQFSLFLETLKCCSFFMPNNLENELDFTDYLESEELQKRLDRIMQMTQHESTFKMEPIYNTSFSLKKEQFEEDSEAIFKSVTKAVQTEATNINNLPDQSQGAIKKVFHVKPVTSKDIIEHCKENHGPKKRIKKKSLRDCGQMRTNETRERLRKKLSLLVNAKNVSAATTTTTTTPPPPPPPPIEVANIETESITLVTQQPPTLKAAAAAAAAAQEKSMPALDPMPLKIKATVEITTTNTNTTTTTTTTMTQKKINNPKETMNNNNNSGIKSGATISKEISNLCEHFSELSTANELKTSEELKKQVLQEQIVKLKQENKFLRMSNNCAARGNACDCHLRGDPRAYSSSPEVFERKIPQPHQLQQQKPAIILAKKPENPQMVNKWVHETLNFIEGIDKSHPRTADPKKAAKKAKQKQRKEEGKRITELTDFRQQFHDIYYKEYADKEQLKLLKAEKTRDKKMIQELETNVKKLHTAKAKIEQSILELIATVKQTNTEFKFAYLPTREQLLSKLKENHAEKDQIKNVTSTATMKEVQNVKVKLINPAFIAAGMPIDNAYSGYHANGQFMYNNPPATNILSGAHTIYAPNANTYEKCAKSDEVTGQDNNRIVTIRRINVPNVPEPQVTVTAKGVTPDKDKLLYTFVNGHLIQSEIEQQQQQQQAVAATTPALTKKQMKKEAQKLAKQFAAFELAKQKEEEIKLQKRNKNKLKKENNKKQQATPLTSSGSISPSTLNQTRDNSLSSVNLKQQQQKQQNKLKQQQENNKKSNKKQQTTTTKQQLIEEKQNKINVVEKTTTKLEKKREKRNKVVDNGQFDNNPYKTLNAGDSDYDSTEYESEEIELEKEVEAVEEKAIIKKKTVNNNTDKSVQQQSDKQKNGKNIKNNNSHKNQQHVIIDEIKSSNIEIKEQNCKKDIHKTKQNVNNTTKINNNKKISTPLTPLTTTKNKVKQEEINKNRNKNNTTNSNHKQQVDVVVVGEVTKRNRNNNTNAATTNNVRKTKVVEQQQQQQQQKRLSQQQKQQQLQQQQQQQLYEQQQNYNMLSQQMQHLRLNTNYSGYESNIGAYAPTNSTSQTVSNKYSIMDQLSRGVQVENLSLPPGITLTKVDPVKSEQLRQKSESIKNISKPLATQQAQQNIPMAWNHPGATIIAPPASSYMNSGYTPTAIDNATGIIMLESANGLDGPPKQVKQNMKILDDHNALDSLCRKKARRKRNKGKSSTPTTTSNQNESKEKPTQIITLRNPMFQQNPNVAMNDPHLQQQMPAGAFVGARSMLGLPIPQALPVDQPAAIIKNENGMFTIRNPALHQAVTNGLAMSGYRGYNNVNYYTPQEAVAESARNAQTQKKSNNEEASFSYFSEKSDEKVAKSSFNQNATKSDLHNNISISCSSINENEEQTLNTEGTGANKQKCISAIGSERESAQQKQRILERNKTPENTWMPSYLGGNNSSSYYNGFNGYTEKNRLFVDLPNSQECAHMTHSCGDESPPPKISGFTSTYLDGIPNTGVIRYDDASFLKNLITNNLNDEVSIHNISKSGYNRSNPAYMTPHVDITPIYGRSSSANMLRQPYNQANEQHLLLDGNQEPQYLQNNTNDYGNRLTSFNIDTSSAYNAASEFGLGGLLNSNKSAKSIDSSSPTLDDRQRSPPFVFEANARNANKKPLPTNSWW